MFPTLSAILVIASLASAQWGERVSSMRRGQGTYNPKSAWMVVDSRRRVLPDIDGTRGLSHWSSRSCNESFIVESHFASVENNILSDIRNFHMKMIQAKVANTTEIVKPPPNQDQYLISSFVPERRRWSSKV